MKKIIWLVLCVGSMACSRQKTVNEDQEISEIELPFYNEPTFTPEWIEETDEAFDDIHTIADFKFQNQKEIGSHKMIWMVNFMSPISFFPFAQMYAL